MTILITGSSGLIGGHLSNRLLREGHEVLRLVRRPVRDDATEVRWTPRKGEIDREGVARADAVIHLAGRSLVDGRWNDEMKREIADSRVDSTHLLADTLASLRAEGRGPTVLLSASATGYYGSRGDDVLSETSEPGGGFLADVCMDWEAAAEPAREAGIRVVHPRIGVVLSDEGGALPKMLPAFKAALGATLGNGRQWFPWVHIDDVAGAMVHALQNETIQGPMNVASPHPVRNDEFTRSLAGAVNRPSFLFAPRELLSLALGREMAGQTLLTSQRVDPRVLVESGYAFRFPELDPALADLVASW